MLVVNRSIEEYIAACKRNADLVGATADVAATKLLADDAMHRYNEAERFACARRGRRARYGWAMAVVRCRRLAYVRAIRKHFEAQEAMRKLFPVYYDE